MIAVLSSDIDNLSHLLRNQVKTEIEYVDATPIYISRNCKFPVLFAEVGTTKTQAACNIVSILCSYPVKKIIGIGNCASLDPAFLAIDDIAICANVLQYDINCFDLGYPFAVIPGLNRALFSSNEDLITKATHATKYCNLYYGLGRMVSADRYLANSRKARRLNHQLGAKFVDMECGSLGEIAHMKKIPFVAVKGISNYADNGAVSEYRSHKNRANQRSLEVALKMLKE